MQPANGHRFPRAQAHPHRVVIVDRDEVELVDGCGAIQNFWRWVELRRLAGVTYDLEDVDGDGDFFRAVADYDAWVAAAPDD